MLFVTPEHNRSIPAVLKNAIDWGSRPYGQSVWSGKTAFVTGTSPGAIGTALAQETLRTMLNFLGVITLPAEAYITFKPGLIDEAANITDDSTQKFLQGFVDRLATLTAQTAPAKQRSAAKNFLLFPSRGRARTHTTLSVAVGGRCCCVRLARRV